MLKEWLPHADVSPTLKRLFEQTEAQSRIADIACIELEAWDGSLIDEDDQSVDRSSALLLAAQVRRLPRPRLTLALVVRGAARVPPGDYTLAEGSAESAIAAFSHNDGHARLSGAPGDGWRAVETDDVVSFPDLLLAHVRLENTKGAAQLTRKLRRLVILERDEEYRISVEVDRAQLARDNILLVHRTLAPQVESILPGCARSGFKQWAPGELQGLPEDWVAWTDVELVDVPVVPESEPDLGVLIPLEWTKIALGGGFALPGHATWLRDAPPEVRVTSVLDRDVTVTIAQTMSLTGNEPTEQELGAFSGAAVIPLDGAGLEEGDYRVSLREASPKGKALVSSSFRIRSADVPSLTVDLEGVLYHPADPQQPLGALSAQLAERMIAPYIAGAACEPCRSLDSISEDVPTELITTSRFDLESEADADDVPTVALTGQTPSCLTGAGHLWALPEATRAMMLGKKKVTKIDAHCKSCGVQKWFPPTPATDEDRERQAPAS